MASVGRLKASRRLLKVNVLAAVAAGNGYHACTDCIKVMMDFIAAASDDEFEPRFDPEAKVFLERFAQEREMTVDDVIIAAVKELIQSKTF